MKYAKHRNSHAKQGKTNPLALFVGVLALITVVVLAVMLRPKSDRDDVQEQATSDAAVQTSASVAAEETTPTASEEKRTFEEIELLPSVSDFDGFGGIARRGEEEGIFTHVVVGTLPVIDTSQQFYEGWLVKPGVTQFFSTGEMFPRADGKWGLLYEIGVNEAGKNVYEFSEVVITREDRDGNPAPSPVHVIEGRF